ncbi:MAG TPA: AAA family ATPase, partial [Solirubrobacteraceae bacterium]
MSMESIGEEPGPVGAEEIASAQQLGRQVALAITDAVEVRRDLLDLVLVCVAAEGHILIEDLPGVGKTTLARSVARAFDLQFARVQCTADLLPADVVGVNVFNQREDRFEFRPGPIFANVVIVDEINRASPKTQSGLLECMQERRVTVDVHTHELARPFVVLATQNPIEFEGTYPLPEAQVDRFMCRVSLGYPTAQGEVNMLRAHEAGDRVQSVEAVATAAELL